MLHCVMRNSPSRHVSDDDEEEENNSQYAEHKKQPTAKRAEVMRRKKLLQTDEALQKRHKELVQSGAVDEEAFWAAATGRRAPAAEKVIKAPSNELLGRRAARRRVDGTDGHLLAVSRKIAFVFSMYPAVRRAHAAHVPKGDQASVSESPFRVDGVEAAGVAVGISHRWRAGGTRASKPSTRHTRAVAAPQRAGTQRLAPPSRHSPCRVDGVRAVPTPRRDAHTNTHTQRAGTPRRDPERTPIKHAGHVRGAVLGQIFPVALLLARQGRAVLEKGQAKADVADDLFARHEEPGDDALQVAPEVRKAVDLSRTDADRFISSTVEDVVDPAAPAASRVAEVQSGMRR